MRLIALLGFKRGEMHARHAHLLLLARVRDAMVDHSTVVLDGASTVADRAVGGGAVEAHASRHVRRDGRHGERRRVVLDGLLELVSNAKQRAAVAQCFEVLGLEVDDAREVLDGAERQRLVLLALLLREHEE